MVKMSTKGRYGVRFMLDLALHQGEGLVLLKDCAMRQDISEKYLWQVLAPLKAAGLIDSVRGAQGGYRLSKHPSEISLNDILTVLEGELTLVDCVRQPSRCSRERECVARDLWCELSEILQERLASISLEEFARRHRAKAAHSHGEHDVQ